MVAGQGFGPGAKLEFCGGIHGPCAIPIKVGPGERYDELGDCQKICPGHDWNQILAQVLGMSADDVFQAYCKKNEVNFKRQESGYRVKDESDSGHI